MDQQSRLPGLAARAFGNPLRINSFVFVAHWHLTIHHRLHHGSCPSFVDGVGMWMAQIVLCPYKEINFHINLVHAFSGEGIKFRKSPESIKYSCGWRSLGPQI